MKAFKLTADQKKIVNGLHQAYVKLLEDKKRTNSKIAIMKDGNICSQVN
jgi:hypothetical protein